jgi:hypothetical protein
MGLALQFYKTGNVGLVLPGRGDDLRGLFFDKIFSWQPFSGCRQFSTLLCRILGGSTRPIPYVSIVGDDKRGAVKTARTDCF